ncbi:hypothetical protein ACFXGI_06005 [Streptomyces sp. NPDC059355]|uniref:hypothetical protein n=1 Tax=Streptomyces sp. NPDC059355 TaxID=3346811 RepID=UPI0036CFB923
MTAKRAVGAGSNGDHRIRDRIVTSARARAHAQAPDHPSVVLGLDHLRKGEDGPGARLFVEEVSMGPGMWDELPQDMREAFVAHAQTWLDEQSDPEWASSP